MPNVSVPSDGLISMFPAEAASLGIKSDERLTIGNGHKHLAARYNDSGAGISGGVPVKAERPDKFERRFDGVICRAAESGYRVVILVSLGAFGSVSGEWL